jgi:hypothetical protein
MLSCRIAIGSRRDPSDLKIFFTHAMASPKSPSCSLFVIPARKARRAVIFRRGPSRQVRLISWNLEDDSFQRGQWLKGRVYERRADLSPSGAFLVYFAGKQKAPHPTWTAVSRPPFLTALAFWPKGDTWGGGGLFLTEYKLQLDNHCAPTETKGPLQLSPFDRATGVHEHERVWGARLLRDGWHRLPAGIEDQDSDAPVLYAYNPPVIFARPAPKAGKGEAPVLEMLLHGALQKDGPFYRITHRLRLDDEVVLGLGPSDWADWDHNGQLLFAKAGKLFRLAGPPWDESHAR